MIRNATVGVDVGTTFIKSVVFADDLTPLATAKVRTPWTRVPSGAEADPQTLAYAAATSIDQAVGACVDPVRVVALGVTSMGETGVLSDAAGRPLGPAIAWHDRRGDGRARQVAGDLPGFASTAGRRLDELPSVVKWRWLLSNGVDRSQANRWDSVAEWVVRSLGGTPPTELSLASRTGGLRVRTAVPFDEAFAWAGASSTWIRELAPAGAPAGVASEGPSAIRGAALTVAGLDCYASAFALGIDQSHTTLLSCGTSGSAIRVLDAWPDDGEVTRGVELDFTIDRFTDGARPVVLGATPCGLILQPLFDLLGAPADNGESPPGHRPAPGAQLSPHDMWQRAFDAVADGEARLVRDINTFGQGLTNVVAAGGWIAEPQLRESLERRLGGLLTVDPDETTAARGAAMMARNLIG